MPGELERELTGAFGRPRPTRDATARARAAALATLPPPRRRSFGWIAVAVAGALIAAVGLGAAALAATGKLHVVLGARRAPAHAPARLNVPPRTQGIALVAGGKLWLTTRRGLRIEGMQVASAELSPHALYAVVGLGTSLVALAPGGRYAWTHETGGRVAAASWSPDGLKIAYVVQRRSGMQLRMIEGDGDHDRLLDPHVAAVKPTWRADSLAVTYSRPRHIVVLDFKRGTRRVVAGRLARPTAPRALSPRRDLVAIAVRTRHAIELRIRQRGKGGSSTLLLRVRVGRAPVSISWR